MSRKMLRGISTCLCGCIRVRANNRLFPRTPRVPRVYTFLVKEYSSDAGVEEGGDSSEKVGMIMDQSFTATHYVPDGRKFQFATVMVKVMKKEESPLRIWEQACALLSGNSPTLAVAFISKPSKSALRTVQELAGHLSPSCSSSCPASESSSEVSFAALSTECGASASSFQSVPCEPLDTPLAPSEMNLESDSSESIPPHFPGTPQSLSPPGETPTKPVSVPFIGCVVEDLGVDYQLPAEGGSTFVENLKSSSHSRMHAVNGAEAPHGDQESTTGGLVFNSSVRVLDSENVQVEDENGEEGTLSDWENLCTEYCEEAANMPDLKVDGESDDEEEDCKSGPVEQISLGFLNALLRPKNLVDSVGDGRALEGNDWNGGIQSRQVERDVGSDEEMVAHARRIVTVNLVSETKEYLVDGDSRGQRSPSSAHDGGISGDSLWGDVEGTITVESVNGDGVCKEGVPGSNCEEDIDYKLVLCVAHMPGTKVVSFHSATTGLPSLPDLENAVTENNPHMLLLGAPGFLFPDFIQRLVTVFPAGCRAGAFLAPLFTSKQNKWTKNAIGKKSGPLFFGTQISKCGVVGLALSSEDKGSEVPIGAFAEFAKMSLGMPRISGYIFIDEPLSKSLFLPKNVPLRHVSPLSKAVVAPSAVLEQLRKRLLKESAVPSKSESSTSDDQAMAPGKMMAVVATSRTCAESISWQLLASSPVKEDLGNLDNLPLALLDSVLFPGWSMPFYIYEPCYRTMVRRCVEEGKPFGLSSMHRGSWASEAVESGEVIGTVANLKIHSLESDCRSYVIAHGVQRFRVINERIWSEPGSFGLTMGQVEFFDDIECDTDEEKQDLLELAKRAISLCCEVMSEAQSAPGLAKSAHDPRLASFAIGHVLNVPTRVKRRWLKMVCTKTRLLEQITFLETKA